MTEQRFGGPWTQEKLEIIKKYLDAYTTALKFEPFNLIYVDAFAGSGSWRSEIGYDPEDYNDFEGVHRGSVSLALEVTDRPFDRFVFIEEDSARSLVLDRIRLDNYGRSIEVRNGDANEELPRFCRAMGNYDRAVVFLDPYATQVDWSTVEEIAGTRKIDCWILFPLMAIARLMPRNDEPPIAHSDRLDTVFGGREHWEDLYQAQSQLSLFAKQVSSVEGVAIKLLSDTNKGYAKYSRESQTAAEDCVIPRIHHCSNCSSLQEIAQGHQQQSELPTTF